MRCTHTTEKKHRIKINQTAATTATKIAHKFSCMKIDIFDAAKIAHSNGITSSFFCAGVYLSIMTLSGPGLALCSLFTLYFGKYLLYCMMHNVLHISKLKCKHAAAHFKSNYNVH